MTAFDGTCAIVTGAASGLGAATAIGFARGGARVIINCVSSAPDAEATADLCSPAGATVRVWLLIDAAAPARAGRGTGRAARSSAPAQLLADRAPRQRGSHLTLRWRGESGANQSLKWGFRRRRITARFQDVYG